MRRYKELDALRGIAACSVMLFHFATMANAAPFLLRLGVTGVDLFFLISGYVILLTLEKTKTANDFIISRLSRLYPSYLTMLSITLAVIYFLNRDGFPSMREIAANLTMMQPLFKARYIDDSYWTLTVEMQFYIYMLLIFITGRLRNVVRVSLVFLLIVMIYYGLSSTFFPDTWIYILPRSFFPMISHFQLFFAGILFYKIQTGGGKLIYHLLIAVCFLFNIYLFDKSGRAHFFFGVTPYIAATSFYFGLFYLFINKKLQFLDMPVLTFLGSISYCLYLIHLEVGKILFAALTGRGVPVFAIEVILITIMIAIASAVTFFVEKPAIASIRKKWLPGLRLVHSNKGTL